MSLTKYLPSTVSINILIINSYAKTDFKKSCLKWAEVIGSNCFVLLLDLNWKNYNFGKYIY